MLIEAFKERVAGFQVGDEIKLEALCAEWNEEVTNNEAYMFRDLLAEETDRAEALAIENAELREAQTDTAARLKHAEEDLLRLNRALDKANQTIKTLIEEGR